MTRQHITHAGAALLILGAALATGSGPRAIPAHAQRLADGKVVTIRLDTTARVFDMSPTGSTAPPGWMAPSFDDSSWDHAITAQGNGVCTVVYKNGMWGPQHSDGYLFRQTFVLPKSQSYYGSELDYTTAAPLYSKVNRIPGLAINGKPLYPQVDFNSSGGRVAIVRYLHPGLNVLTAAINHSMTNWCSAFEDTITLRMTGLQRADPLVLSWRKVPGAARYYLQVWLVNVALGQTITPNSEVNIAMQTTGARATLDDAAMPAGTYQWRVAAVNAHGSLLSGWTQAQTVTLGAKVTASLQAPAPTTGGDIDGIACQSEMLYYHIHAHLTLYENGRAVPVPAYVGISYSSAINAGGQHTCYFWLHTHDASGVVHIESPTPRLYTLGQFLDIWRYTSLWDAQGGLAASAGVVVDPAFVNALRSAQPGDIHAFVGGEPVSGDYRSITLTAHKLITVEIGTPLKPPTTDYTFPANE